MCMYTCGDYPQQQREECDGACSECDARERDLDEGRDKLQGDCRKAACDHSLRARSVQCQ